MHCWMQNLWSPSSAHLGRGMSRAQGPQLALARLRSLKDSQTRVMFKLALPYTPPDFWMDLCIKWTSVIVHMLNQGSFGCLV